MLQYNFYSSLQHQFSHFTKCYCAKYFIKSFHSILEKQSGESKVIGQAAYLSQMNNCLSQVFNYPISYMGRIRKLKMDQILLKGTEFFPSYPLLLASSIVCNLILAAWMIYQFMRSDIHPCYSGVTLGIQVLSCLYPIYQFIIFLTLMISVSTSQSNIWKICIMLVFTMIATSFGFGGMGVIYTCMVNYSDPIAVPSSFLTQNYFIQIMVYAMIVFLGMYVLFVPFTSWLESRRNPELQRTCCQCFLYVIHVIFQILLLIGAIMFLGIALGGIPILFYLLNGIRKEQTNTQQQFFAFAITSLVAPSGIFLISLAFSKWIGCDRHKQMQVQKNDDQNEQELQLSQPTKNKQNNEDESSTRRKSIIFQEQISNKTALRENTQRHVLLQTNQNKMFGQDEFRRSRKSNLKEFKK